MAGISPGLGALCSFASTALSVASLATANWINAEADGNRVELGLSRACLSNDEMSACNFYFMSIAYIADQPWGWPTESWKVAMALTAVAAAMSLSAWILGSLASCFQCLCCVAWPLCGACAALSVTAFALLLSAILKLCGNFDKPEWAMFGHDGNVYPVCGPTSASFDLGDCHRGWGLWVAVAACVLSFAAVMFYFPAKLCSRKK